MKIWYNYNFSYFGCTNIIFTDWTHTHTRASASTLCHYALLTSIFHTPPNLILKREREKMSCTIHSLVLKVYLNRWVEKCKEISKGRKETSKRSSSYVEGGGGGGSIKGKGVKLWYLQIGSARGRENKEGVIYTIYIFNQWIGERGGGGLWEAF